MSGNLRDHGPDNRSKTFGEIVSDPVIDHSHDPDCSLVPGVGPILTVSIRSYGRLLVHGVEFEQNLFGVEC
jgi:hypothetical protein